MGSWSCPLPGFGGIKSGGGKAVPPHHQGLQDRTQHGSQLRTADDPVDHAALHLELRALKARGQGLADEGRIAVYRSTLELISDYPWFGTGMGTFARSFPAYRSSEISMWGMWDIAHNTPLELASEVGAPLAVAVCVGWLIMFAVLGHAIITRRRDVIVPLSAFSVSMLGNLHSFVDFSLQIPGYAIVAFALLGVGLAQSFGNMQFQERSDMLKKSPH